MTLHTLFVSKVNQHRKGLKVYWWRQPSRSRRNFGDEITPILIEKIWGIRCHWTRIADCELIGAGSILEILRDNNPEGHKVTVWGSGFIKNGPTYTNKDITFCLVRGPKSAQRIRDNSGKLALGDPGLLTSRVFKPASHVTHKVGIVAHMRDLENITSNFSGTDVLIISPFQTPHKVAEDITSCELIFSSSLHGLIFADSYGIPNFRLTHNELEGGDYKFEDYYESTNRSYYSYTQQDIAKLIQSNTGLLKLKKSYRPIEHLRKMQDTIITAFPFESKIPK